MSDNEMIFMDSFAIIVLQSMLNREADKEMRGYENWRQELAIECYAMAKAMADVREEFKKRSTGDSHVPT